ncbi:MAG: 30S ribosomal protein S8 [Candidatus Gracilibacteria bacterium]|nr:30S ribosomal protein S8 [Candidatus Gracilibacteria bacterium]
MIYDPIADLLTRIRNGYLARLDSISLPHSIIKEQILRILKKNGHVVSYEVSDLGNGKKDIVVALNDVRMTKYIPTFKRISKPGQRIYLKSKDVKKSRNGLGIYVLSTPKGVITGYEARALNVGGELLCEIF